ncbi:MAG: DNA gyrase C-terminal beta-propeller domain-containing protein [Anaerolineae bacterium]
MGVGKRSSLSEYPTQGRYGTGVATANLSVKTGRLAAGAVASASDRLLMVSEKGNNKAVYVRSLPKARRATQGKELIAIRGRDRLAALLLLSPSEAEAVKPASRKATKSRTSRATGSGKKTKTSKAQSGSKATKSRSSRTTGSGKKTKTSKAQSGSKATTSPSTGRKKRSKKR